MKSLWNSFKIAFSMFSKIPVPQAEWTEENMKYMLCFFHLYIFSWCNVNLSIYYKEMKNASCEYKKVPD